MTVEQRDINDCRMFRDVFVIVFLRRSCNLLVRIAGVLLHNDCSLVFK